VNYAERSHTPISKAAIVGIVSALFIAVVPGGWRSRQLPGPADEFMKSWLVLRAIWCQRHSRRAEKAFADDLRVGGR
jgi:hypothetical protein